MTPISNQNVVFIPLIDINEGLLTGTITKASLVGTKNKVYIIPRSAVKVLGESFSQYKNDAAADELLVNLLQDANMSVEELEKKLEEVLSVDDTRRIFPIQELELFNIKTGLFTGGLFLKMPGEARKAANIRGKANKILLYEFYQAQIKK